ncbi:helix-turn-helix transcriptional regulator [Fodinicola acaciae]|uniref:helix-turn-helix transcriptional regulator n=1 Tax=Fodinicola acaciae TaxID=2681555 RepID=UPI001652A635|nr:helix-turn-helix transcriptional regulator [Fodinicola acaciae]
MTDPAEQLRRRELAEFLRSRRERISPEQVGLPPSGRRRTPGLRREEVAQLAGVGVTWYTWLEQGRDIHASEQVLEAVSRTLRFDRHERAHLFRLAGATPPDFAKSCGAIPPEMELVLEQLRPFPASIVNARYDLLAYNRVYATWVCDLDAMPFEERNTLWLAFTHPAWRATMVNWEESVQQMVGQYRAAMTDHIAEPTWKCLVTRLRQASPEFVELWERHDVAWSSSRSKQLLHAEHGLLELNYTQLWLDQRLGTRMVTYAPATEETRLKLAKLDANAS